MTDTPAPKPDTTIYWRLYARVRIHSRLKVQVYIGEPQSEKFYQKPEEVTVQNLTLTRLGRMLRKLTRP